MQQNRTIFSSVVVFIFNAVQRVNLKIQPYWMLSGKIKLWDIPKRQADHNHKTSLVWSATSMVTHHFSTGGAGYLPAPKILLRFHFISWIFNYNWVNYIFTAASTLPKLQPGGAKAVWPLVFLQTSIKTLDKSCNLSENTPFFWFLTTTFTLTGLLEVKSLKERALSLRQEKNVGWLVFFLLFYKTIAAFVDHLRQADYHTSIWHVF